MRVPLANASLTDCVFEVERATTVEEVNALLQGRRRGRAARASSATKTRPLVSIDYRTDPRSSIIDALSTMVVNGTQVKIYAWYDNEWGYANRTVELARLVGKVGAEPTLARLSPDVRQYLLVTGNYWAFTLTDGALRMLVVLHFHQLGYSPLQIAMLFLFYEIFGVVTNLVGGWLGARLGLNRTMNIGLAHAGGRRCRCSPVPAALLTRAVGDGGAGAVGHRQGPQQDERQEQHQAAGARRGAGHAVPLGGGADRLEERAQGRRLLPRRRAADVVGFTRRGAGHGRRAGAGLAGQPGAAASATWARRSSKPKFRDLLSKSRAINLLSAARLFLFGARDVWFVVALPVFLAQSLGWDFWQVGGFLAAWVIGYGDRAVAGAVRHRPAQRRKFPTAARPSAGRLLLADHAGGDRAAAGARLAGADRC